MSQSKIDICLIIMLKLVSKIKSSLINNENKNRIINLELLKNYAKSDDFTLLDAGCGTRNKFN